MQEAMLHYKLMLKGLQYVDENLDVMLIEFKKKKALVDKRHKNCNKGIVAGCATSFVGGTMILAGIAAAPFTFGVSIGFSAAGAALTICGTYTTTAAKISHKVCSKSDYKKSNRKLVAFLEHHEAAKKSFEKAMKACEDIAKILFDYEKEFSMAMQDEKKPQLEHLREVVSCTIASTYNATYIPALVTTTAGTIAVNSATIGMTIVVPEQIHAAAKLALHPEQTFDLVAPCAKMAARVMKCSRNADIAGVKLGVLASGKALGAVFSSVGGVLTAIGMTVDAITLILAAHELAKDKKCKTSKKFSADIEKLEKLQNDLQTLKDELCGGNCFNSIVPGNCYRSITA